MGIAEGGKRLTERLAGLLPAGPFRAGLPPRRVRTVRIATLPPDAAGAADLAQAGRRWAPVDVALAQSLFLRKTIAIPGAARRDAAPAIALQMRQTMPAQAAGLIWRARPVRTVAGQVEYEVFVLKQDRLTDLLRDAGACVRMVMIDDAAGMAPLIDNRKQADRPERFWNRASATLCGLLLAAVLAAQGWHLSRARSEEAALGQELMALRDRAAAARAEAEARDSAAAARLRDATRLDAESRRLAQLADLTRALDDGVWLSSVAVDGGAMRLAGFSRADIATLVAAIQALPWVGSVAAEGSIVVDPVTGEGRFQLVILPADEVVE